MAADPPDTAAAGADRHVSRRAFLGAAAAGAGSLALTGSGLARAFASTASPAAPSALPPPAGAGIDHVVLVTMENRSFDHYLGWLAGADGRQAGLTYLDRAGNGHATHHLATHQGCADNDPDHGYIGGRVEYNGGNCDGWLWASTNDEFCIGYYLASDLHFYGRAAPHWTVCDRYFAATMGPTYPNRLYLHSAQTDRQDDSTTMSTLPTIWDSLAAAGVSHTYYFSDIPFTALWGSKYAGISRPYSQFLADCTAGQLPAVSYLDPRFEDEGSGTSGDDHPHADIRVGQAFLNQVYDAVTTGPNWASTVLVITYDEWGGFFDHVKPSTAPDANPADGLRGFRVPTFVISPLARRRTVAHRTYDHTSILKMIEWRWGLSPLTPRDATARNLAEVLDFSRPPDLFAPQWSVPPAVGEACPATPGAAGPAAGSTTLAPTEHELTWRALADMAAHNGFEVIR